MNADVEQTTVIKPIDPNTIHSICSGQVVINLAVAVKELVENSLDAGATTIQIKLIEYGSESIEVIDNGCGVEEVNFQALTLKHHTSKISDFNDVYGVETFGFRGEALSSLCALSDVTITTQHKNAAIGAVLKFDHQGILINSSKILRKCGTTVKLQNLFCTLPVRRTEFLKNLKKEFSKMCNILYAYGIINTAVRIKCTNQVSKTKFKSKDDGGDASRQGVIVEIMNTEGNSIESNIRSIFGVKQKQNLLKIVEKHPCENTLKEFGINNRKINFKNFQLEGYISSCAHGCGRNTSDRQFYYINFRPVDNPKVSKLINEVYHQFNNHQDPFVVLNIKVTLGFVDINVTPDKRQVYIQDEKILLAVIKESLLNVFQDIPNSLVLQNIGIINKDLEIDSKNENPKTIEIFEEPNEKTKKFKNKDFSVNINSLLKFYKKSSNSEKAPDESDQKSFKDEYKINVHNNSQQLKEHVNLGETDTENKTLLDKYVEFSKSKTNLLKTQEEKIQDLKKLGEKMETGIKNDCKRKMTQSTSENVITTNMRENMDTSPCRVDFKRMKFDEGLTEIDRKKKNLVEMSINMEELKKMIIKEKTVNGVDQNKNEKMNVKFLTEIKPQNNEKAERELQRTISKECFSKMEIIGQFNLGFIIVKLDYDVFIVDQHASDEKYNYEWLRSNTLLQPQKMVNPETLNLTADKEELMVHHKKVFEKNGFAFEFDKAQAPTKRIKLTSVPTSKNVTFGKEDVDELLFLLEDAPENITLRPSRVDKMFASRACRKSFMIGTPLNINEMKKIINHMGEIEQPWNCPHGRPTMRHLVNLCLINSNS